MRHARERRCLRVAASHPRAGFPDSKGLRLPPQRAASPPSSGPPGVSVIQKFSKSERPRALYQAGDRPHGRPAGSSQPCGHGKGATEWSWRVKGPSVWRASSRASRPCTCDVPSCHPVSPSANHSIDSGSPSGENHGAPGSRPSHLLFLWHCLLQVA